MSVDVGYVQEISRGKSVEVCQVSGRVWPALNPHETHEFVPWQHSIDFSHTASLPGSTSSRDQDHKINHENSLGLMSPSSTTWHRDNRDNRDNVWDVRDA